MSHGNTADKCEPNLIPLLDLILQLIMFFMVCTNFLMDEVNATIRLPSAIQAKPLDKAEESVVFSNVDKDGKVLLSRNKNAEVLNVVQLQKFMRDKYENDQVRLTKKQIAKLSLVVLRADKDCTFKQVHDVMSACRRAGFADIQLRAIVRPSGT